MSILQELKKEGVDIATQCELTIKFLSQQALAVINGMCGNNPHLASAVANEVARATNLTLERRITFAPAKTQTASPETAKGPSEKQEPDVPQQPCDPNKESPMPKLTVTNKEEQGGPSARVQNSNGDTAVIHPGEEYTGTVLPGGSLKVLPATEADVAQEAINRSPKQGGEQAAASTAGEAQKQQEEPAADDKKLQDNNQGEGEAKAETEGQKQGENA